MNSSNSLKSLQSFLDGLPIDKMELLDENRATVIGLLKNCWGSLKGNEQENTFPEKIYRAEKIYWDRPVLKFKLERHAKTVNGSSRADLHYWEVDVDHGTAEIIKKGVRQLYPMSPRMDTKKPAKEVADYIINNQDHSFLDWNIDRDCVYLKISAIIPEADPQTTQGRRKRFKEHLEAILNEHEWIKVNKGNKTGFKKKLIAIVQS